MTRQELIQQIKEKQSFLCVGLDTDIDKMPQSLIKRVKKEYEEEELTFGMLLEFNTSIIDATAPYCVAYKPNLAFYEAYGMDGIAAFEGTASFCHGRAALSSGTPDVPGTTSGRRETA